MKRKLTVFTVFLIIIFATYSGYSLGFSSDTLERSRSIENGRAVLVELFTSEG